MKKHILFFSTASAVIKKTGHKKFFFFSITKSKEQLIINALLIKAKYPIKPKITSKKKKKVSKGKKFFSWSKSKNIRTPFVYYRKKVKK
jgi:hypothetical protein